MAETPSPLLFYHNATDELENDIVQSLNSFPDFGTPFDIYCPSDLMNSQQIFSVDPDPLNDEVFDADFFDREENEAKFFIEKFQTSTAHSDLGLPDELDPTQLELDLDLEFCTHEIHENDENRVFFSGLDIGLDIDSDPGRDRDIENRVIGLDLDDGFDPNEEENNDVGGNDDDLMLPLWDSLVLNGNDQSEVNEDFEWEEIDERVDEREVLSMFFGEDNASVSSREGVAVLESLEWEVLLSVQNLETNLEMGNGEFRDRDAHHDEYNYASEYEIFVGGLTESENVVGLGGRPTSKSVVEKLPVVVVSGEDLKKSNVVCAVCKDEMGVGEKVMELPCAHSYHGDCILPWLGIRNTCPVCRYELPVDDPDYERMRRTQRGGDVH